MRRMNIIKMFSDYINVTIYYRNKKQFYVMGNIHTRTKGYIKKTYTLNQVKCKNFANINIFKERNKNNSKNFILNAYIFTMIVINY